ncbi:2260_t:CDS:1, partial [Funneliformis geosporum]
MATLFQELRGAAILAKKGKGNAFENLNNYERIETTNTRFNLKYAYHNRLDFVRVRHGDIDLTGEKEYL